MNMGYYFLKLIWGNLFSYRSLQLFTTRQIVIQIGKKFLAIQQFQYVAVQISLEKRLTFVIITVNDEQPDS